MMAPDTRGEETGDPVVDFYNQEESHVVAFAGLSRHEGVQLYNSLAIAVLWAEEVKLPEESVESRRRFAQTVFDQLPDEVVEGARELDLLIATDEVLGGQESG